MLKRRTHIGRFISRVHSHRRFAGRSIYLRLAVGSGFCLGLAGCQSLGFGTPAPKPVVSPPAAAIPVAADYAVCFPDVFEIEVAGRLDCSGSKLIHPDGQLNLGKNGHVFVEGCTAAEATLRVADALGVPAQQVRCQVSAARSRVVYLVGTGADHPRSIAYRGPERVAELLERTGGLPVDAAPEVRVVRRNVARGTEPETFRVDMAAVRRGDTRTNVVLQPNDEVHVVEDSGVRLASFVPDWLRP